MHSNGAPVFAFNGEHSRTPLLALCASIIARNNPNYDGNPQGRDKQLFAGANVGIHRRKINR
ncbi:MAG: hypothetical protein LBK26_02990 [Rickettsiales bacterium]|jgi:hypothetical protein|nr:hypothetical protein [Rickettsiales bacterium]